MLFPYVSPPSHLGTLVLVTGRPESRVSTRVRSRTTYPPRVFWSDRTGTNCRPGSLVKVHGTRHPTVPMDDSTRASRTSRGRTRESSTRTATRTRSRKASGSDSETPHLPPLFLRLPLPVSGVTTPTGLVVRALWGPVRDRPDPCHDPRHYGPRQDPGRRPTRTRCQRRK